MPICARPMEKKENPTVYLLLLFCIQLVYNENYELLKLVSSPCLHRYERERSIQGNQKLKIHCLSKNIISVVKAMQFN